MYDGTGLGTHFLELKGVLDFEGFDGGVDVDFFFNLRVDRGCRNADGLGIQCFFLPFSQSKEKHLEKRRGSNMRISTCPFIGLEFLNHRRFLLTFIFACMRSSR